MNAGRPSETVSQRPLSDAISDDQFRSQAPSRLLCTDFEHFSARPLGSVLCDRQSSAAASRPGGRTCVGSLSLEALLEKGEVAESIQVDG